MSIRIPLKSIALAVLLTMVTASQVARASVVVNELEDLSTSSLSDWTQVASGSASRTGATITTDAGSSLYYHRDLGLDGPNAFLFEAVVSADALAMDGERGARMWVKFTDNATPPMQVFCAEVRLAREAGENMVKLHNGNSGAVLAALTVDWASGPIRVRVKRQQVGGNAYVFVQAEPATSWDDPAQPHILNDPSSSIGVLRTSFTTGAGTPEVGFGNVVAGSYSSVWESVHWTQADDTTTVLPYWPPAPAAPGLAHVDQGTGSLQRVDLTADVSVGYLANDLVYAELDADDTTYTGGDRATGGTEVWTFTGLGDQQSVTGRVVAREVSGRSTVGDEASTTIPDRLAPAALSILRADASPTNATSVGWVVTFDEGVTSVDATDFVLQWTSGSGTGSVTSVTSISATAFTVTASGLDGEGTLRLDFAASPSITDLAGNALSTPAVTGEEYVIDTIAPAVVSILRADANPTRASSLGFTVAFSQAVSGLATSDFVLATTGTAAGTVSLVTPVTQAEYTVTVTGVAGDGTLRLDLVDLGTITDAVGNPIGGAGAQDFTTGEAYTIDNTPPTPPTVTGTTPINDPLPTWSWTAGAGGAGYYRYGYTEGDWLETDVTVTSFQPASALAEGTYTLYVQERDALGNWSYSGHLSIVVDLTAPFAPLVTGESPTTDTTPTWSWSSGGGGAGVYRFGWEEGTWIEAGSLDTSYTPDTALAEGEHELYVQEQDDAGNWSESGSFGITIEPTGDATPDEPGEESGCGCRSGGPASGPVVPVCLALFLLLALRRRR